MSVWNYNPITGWNKRRGKRKGGKGQSPYLPQRSLHKKSLLKINTGKKRKTRLYNIQTISGEKKGKSQDGHAGNPQRTKIKTDKDVILVYGGRRVAGKTMITRIVAKPHQLRRERGVIRDIRWGYGRKGTPP